MMPGEAEDYFFRFFCATSFGSRSAEGKLDIFF